MNAAPPQGETPMSRRGGGPPSHAHAAAPSTTARDEAHRLAARDEARRPAALRRAEELVAALARHDIAADVHEPASGRAAVSIYYGLVAVTDGQEFRWTCPGLTSRDSPRAVSETTTTAATERLAEHYRILRARPLTDVLGRELPLLADVLVADHVVPR